MKPFSILVVDDNTDFLNGIVRNLKKQFPDMVIEGATSGEDALALLHARPVGVMLSDLRMPHMSGNELLKASLQINSHLCIIIITGHGTVEAAVEALKEGAWDFLTKPVDRKTLYYTVERAVEHYGLASENIRLQKVIRDLKPDAPPGTESPVMQQLYKQLAALAATDYTVLITGESGSGKEYIARMIHRTSLRKKAPCHTLNCPAIPEPLLESELFGHVKGSFTGAQQDRSGFFLSADKGTLILDEIGDISPAVQVKLLKFLQDKEIKPVGSSASRTVDVRILALTNQNLKEKINQGLFREDLYYRLNVLSIQVPPLRRRKADIPLLVHQFITQSCQELNISTMPIDPAALAHLTRQPWPGNVRQLLNYVRRLVVFSGGRPIDLSLINTVEQENNLADGESRTGAKRPATYREAKKEALDHFSKNYLDTLFKQTDGNISQASRISGLERASIQKIIRRLKIDMTSYRQAR